MSCNCACVCCGRTSVQRNLLYDDFTNTEPAPVASPNDADTIGEWTFVQTDGQFSEGSGELAVPTQVSPTWGDLTGRMTDSVDLRANMGNVVLAKFEQSTRGDEMFGWWPTTLLDDTPNAALYTESNKLIARIGSTNIDIINPDDYLANTEQNVAIAWLDDSYHILHYKDGIWYRDWVEYATATVAYGGFSNYDSVGSIQRFMIKRMPDSLFAPYINIPSLSTANGSLTGSDPELTEMQFVMKFELTTLPSAGSIKIAFNYKDSDDYNYLEIKSTGVWTLSGVVAGVDFDGSPYYDAVSVVADGDILTYIVDWEFFQAFVNSNTDNTTWPLEKFGYVTNDWQVLDMGTGGVISDFKVWNRTLQTPTGLDTDIALNGSFASAANWALGTNWSIAAGVASHTGADGTITQTPDTLTLRKVYRVNWDVSGFVTGVVNPLFGNAWYIGSADGNGSWSYRAIVRDDPTFLFETFGTADLDIDNVVIQEYLYSNENLANSFNSLLSL